MTRRILALALAVALLSGPAGAVEIGVGTKNFTPPPGTPSYLVGEDGAPAARRDAAPAPIEVVPNFEASMRTAAAPARRTAYRAKRFARSRHLRHVAARRRVAGPVRHRTLRHVAPHRVRHVVRSTKVARPKIAHRRVAG